MRLLLWLGRAAFFGMGAYSAALFAKLVIPDPLVGLLVGIVAAGLLGALCSATILRGSDLTRLMVTLSVGVVLMGAGQRAGLVDGRRIGLRRPSTMAELLRVKCLNAGSGKVVVMHDESLSPLTLVKRWPCGAATAPVKPH